MFSFLLAVLKHLLRPAVIVALAWLAVCLVAMLAGHTDALPVMGTVLVDLLDTLFARPLHDALTVVAGSPAAAVL